jgi:hypothetical protein
MFNTGEGSFKDRDLYLFCFNILGGIITAGPPAILGTDVRTLTDPTGKVFGEDLFNAPREGTTEVSYMLPRPGADNTPVGSQLRRQGWRSGRLALATTNENHHDRFLPMLVNSFPGSICVKVVVGNCEVKTAFYFRNIRFSHCGVTDALLNSISAGHKAA